MQETTEQVLIVLYAANLADMVPKCVIGRFKNLKRKFASPRSILLMFQPPRVSCGFLFLCLKFEVKKRPVWTWPPIPVSKEPEFTTSVYGIQCVLSVHEYSIADGSCASVSCSPPPPPPTASDVWKIELLDACFWRESSSSLLCAWQFCWLKQHRLNSMPYTVGFWQCLY